MKNPTILTIDMGAIGATSLFEIRDTLQKEFDANKSGLNHFEVEAAVQSKISLNKLDAYLKELDIRRPSKS